MKFRPLHDRVVVRRAESDLGKWSGTEVKIHGEDLLIMKESDIMGVVAKSVTALANTA